MAPSELHHLTKSRYKPIESYGIVGDMETVALVGLDASIDFMCYPSFDSPTIFAALLDADKGGSFQIHPTLDGATAKQLYLPDSNVLLTRFLSEEGVAEVSDFFQVDEHTVDNVLVRRAYTVRGEVHYYMCCAPRFDYGRATHSVELADGGKKAIFDGNLDGQPDLILHSTVPMEVRNGDLVAQFTLKPGESATFMMEQAHQEGTSPTARENYAIDAFKSTLNYWRSWLSHSKYRGRWRETVNRSALLLKLLTSRKHGSIIASPTFGLPEDLGGTRNWDYRYSWIRDSSFTLYAFMRLGFTEEAHAFMRWLEDRCNESDNHYGGLQLMYGIDGRHNLTETELPHLEGYMGSKPVRIGNGAYSQTQIDIYGELMDSVYLYDKMGGPVNHDLWKNLARILDWITENWQMKDHGIWEIRGGEREFLFTRLMNWVALDRGVRLARKRSLPAPLDKWVKARDCIYHDIFANFYNKKRGAFVQSKGSDVMDASCLLMPLMRFIGPRDPLWLSTMKAVEEDLVYDSLVFRYLMPGQKGKIDQGINPLDGIEGGEGSFSMCSFWYVECLSRSGDLRLARFYFEKMLGYGNHLGLFAEELGSRGEHLGNFPQAFTHLALISAAYDLNRRLDETGDP